MVWAHIAPVCGTCSRARQIRNGGPRPLRSDSYRMGLPNLTSDERQRIDLANNMYVEPCKLFQHCDSRRILVTMDNPSSSLFCLTELFLLLQLAVDFFHSNSQMCMMGGTRPKWTRLVAIFSSISALNIECDGLHSHQPWGKTMDAAGNEFYATSLEAEHPRRFCIAVVQCVLRTQNVTMAAPGVAAKHPLRHQGQQNVRDADGTNHGIESITQVKAPTSDAGFIISWYFLCFTSCRCLLRTASKAVQTIRSFHKYWKHCDSACAITFFAKVCNNITFFNSGGCQGR